MNRKKTLTEKVKESSRRPVPEKSLIFSGAEFTADDGDVSDEHLPAPVSNPTHLEDFRSLLGAAAQRLK